MANLVHLIQKRQFLILVILSFLILGGAGVVKGSTKILYR